MIFILFFYVSFFFFICSLNFFLGKLDFFFSFSLTEPKISALGISFFFSWDNILFARVVAFVAGCTIIFRERYTPKNRSFFFFFLLLSFFVCSMFFLLVRIDFLSIFIAWDFLGVRSFFLVIFYNNRANVSSGMITAISNRIGDFFIICSIRARLIIDERVVFINSNLRCLSLILILARITKRAQFPFSAWLPEAINAPTPVRTLVHSSTLVTAGLFLLFRFQEAAGYSNIGFVLGFLTACLSRVSACCEKDLKKIVAFSTLRQLGFIFRFSCLQAHEIVLFHILTHAGFKSLLFICRGILMFQNFGSQVFKKRFKSFSYFRVVPINISLIGLSGIPFLSGFYSKDLLVEFYLVLSPRLVESFVIFFLLFSTFFYSVRFFYFSNFFSWPKFSLFNKINFDRKDLKVFCLTLLSFFTLFSASLISYLIVLPEIIFLRVREKLFPLLVLTLGFFFFFYKYF